MSPPPGELERAVLGCFLLLGEQATDTLGLTEKHFADARHAVVWDVIRELIDLGDPVDALTVADRLGDDAPRAGGRAYLHQLSDAVPTATNVGHYVKLLRRVHDRREFEYRTRSAMERARSGEDIGELVAELSEFSPETRRADWVPQRSVLGEVLQLMQAGGTNGVKSGFQRLDDEIGGFDQGSVHIVAARPGMGKTAFAMAIASMVARRRSGAVLVVSLEMGISALGQRLLSSESGVPLQRIRAASLSEADMGRLSAAMERMKQDQLEVCRASSPTPGEIRSMVRSYQARSDVALVVVDYLQLIRGRGGSSYERTTSVSRELKATAVACNVPMLVLSQLNRALESRNDKRPMISDLRESGAIEEDAESVMLLFRPGYYDMRADQRDAEVIIGKNRNGRQGSVPFLWHGPIVSYMEAKP